MYYNYIQENLKFNTDYILRYKKYSFYIEKLTKVTAFSCKVEFWIFYA